MGILSYIVRISTMSTQQLVDEFITQTLSKDISRYDYERFCEVKSLLFQRIQELENK